MEPGVRRSPEVQNFYGRLFQLSIQSKLAGAPFQLKVRRIGSFFLDLLEYNYYVKCWLLVRALNQYSPGFFDHRLVRVLESPY